MLKLNKKRVGGSEGGSPPLRAGRPPRAPEARAAAPAVEAAICSSYGSWEEGPGSVKGDIWLICGHHLHLANKDVPGTLVIIMIA